MINFFYECICPLLQNILIISLFFLHLFLHLRELSCTFPSGFLIPWRPSVNIGQSLPKDPDADFLIPLMYLLSSYASIGIPGLIYFGNF